MFIFVFLSVRLSLFI